MKKNIKSLSGSLEKIVKLNGVKYDLKEEYFNTNDPIQKAKLTKESENEIGFLAQELMQIFPEVVFLDSTNNLYSVSYTRLVPVLVEAIKEQQNMIKELKAQFETIEEDCCNSSLKSALIKQESDNFSNKLSAILYQNNPNPFKEKTNITCFIPSNSIESWIYIYDLNGTELDQFKIKGIGEQSITVPKSKLNPGMYLYSLVVDRSIIDTKRMILTN